MIISDKWKDYEVIDTSGGEKLERWGDYILVRPDPQVIWDTPKKDRRWKNPNGHYYRSDKGGGHWEFNDLPEEWSVSYGSLKFNLKPFSFKHTGLFPEQAANWDHAAGIIRERKKQGKDTKVLNLFAYTGGATISAAAAGAHVTHVDASKGMTGWAKENALLSGIPYESCRWIVEDCRKFAEREIRRGNKYDAVILDPPSYGRGPKGEVWKMEEDIFSFLKLVAELISEDAAFVILNSYTTGLQPAVLSYMMNDLLSKRYGGKVTADEVGLPVSGNGLILPCGATARWQC
ncbi:MAG: class I SAM-dependent methyltransferase [Lachnospiraceae bacterium]|nr:class I SAM-dependent methyltransferase [Lachnospiraceae bacterium]